MISTRSTASTDPHARETGMDSLAVDAATNPDAITFTDAETHRCPFDAYDRLRTEAPVYLDPGTGHYVLTRYADVRSAVVNFRKLSSAVGLVGIRDSDAAGDVEAMYAR